MKQLKDILNEGILGDIEDRVNTDDIRFVIKDWIDNNYIIYKGDIEISDNPNKDGKYEVNSNAESIKLKYPGTDITNGLFVWNIVEGDFNCSACPIISLEGCPRRIESGNFYCEGTNITTLEGGPEYVGGSFICSYCGKLKNDLKGSPKYVGHEFYCNGCGNLKSLKGITPMVLDLYCHDCVYLLSLKHAPTKILRNFDCSGCINLLNFDCAKTVVKNNFCCSRCSSLKDLSNAPKSIGNDFIARKISQFTKYELENCTKIKGKVFC